MLNVITMFGVIMITGVFVGIGDILLLMIGFLLFTLGYQQTFTVVTQADYLDFVFDGMVLLYGFWLMYVTVTRYVVRRFIT